MPTSASTRWSTQAKADLDAARKATAQLAFWLTASLLLGAFCASLAATEGGGLRDGTWGSRSVVRIVTSKVSHLKGTSHAYSTLAGWNSDPLIILIMLLR